VPKAFFRGVERARHAVRSVDVGFDRHRLAALPWRSLSFNASNRSARRATSATDAPLSASARANCCPSPLDAPVTSAHAALQIEHVPGFHFASG